MSINLRVASSVIRNLFKPSCAWLEHHQSLANEVEIHKVEQVKAPKIPKASPHPSRTPMGFYERAKEIKALHFAGFVVLHCFAGARRSNDFEDWCLHWAALSGLTVLIESVDLAWDASWDLSCSDTITLLIRMIREGLLDIIVGGPPCATWSMARYAPGGPPPLRQRGVYSWGLPGLPDHLQRQLDLASTLMVNFIGLCEELHRMGGSFFLEHPADPGRDPYPSIFATELFKAFQERTGCVVTLLHQCMFGGPCLKPTMIAHTLEGIIRGALLCDGGHKHEPSRGIGPGGTFHTRRLQTYPSALNDMLAWACVLKLSHFAQFGRSTTSTHKTSRLHALSWKPLQEDSNEIHFQFVNEGFAAGTPTFVKPKSPAFYLPVDDGLTITDPKGPVDGTQVMHAIADGLEQIGFVVPDRQCSAQVAKVLGFHVEHHPLKLTLPAAKKAALQVTLLWLTAAPMVDVTLLRSVMGVWIWGAALNRSNLSIPASVFQFIEENVGRRVKWWPSARREVKLMAALVPSLELALTLPVWPCVFATDAEGANNLDKGGYGIVGTLPETSVTRACFEAGCQPAATLTRLDGALHQLKNPLKELLARIPSSRLPSVLFNDDTQWGDLWSGRWNIVEHITLGEGRTTNILLQHLADHPGTHGHRFLSMCDNLGWCAASTKGRSSAFRVNAILRRRAALLIAIGSQMPLPWIDTSRMPADFLSRSKL